MPTAALDDRRLSAQLGGMVPPSAQARHAVELAVQMMDFSKSQLEAIAWYERRYTTIADYPLVAGRPIHLSDNTNQEPRRCRFCGRAEPGVPFSSTAHSVPEFLGNKAVISMNECDACNQFLAHQYEDHLAKWFGPIRTVTQMRGKKGVPKYSTVGIQIEMGPEGLKFVLEDATLFAQLDKPGPIDFKLPLDMPSQPYAPIRAAMALVKTACSVCPTAEVAQCQPAIDWLMGRAVARIRRFPVLYAFTPGPDPYATGRVMILRRKTDDLCPCLWCIVATTNHRFQFFVPFCPSDARMKGGEQTTFTCRHYPVPFGENWPFGKTEYSLLDFAGDERVVKLTNATMNVDRAERVTRT